MRDVILLALGMACWFSPCGGGGGGWMDAVLCKLNPYV